MNGMMKKMLGLSLVVSASYVCAFGGGLKDVKNNTVTPQPQQILNTEKKQEQTQQVTQNQNQTPPAPQSLNEAKKQEGNTVVKKDKMIVRLLAAARAQAKTGWDKTKTGLKSVGAFFAKVWTTVTSWIGDKYTKGRTTLAAQIAKLRRAKTITPVVTPK